MASAHAYSGMYVLAVAARVVDRAEEVRSRTEAEKDLSLLGAGREVQGNWTKLEVEWGQSRHYDYKSIMTKVYSVL